MLDTRRSSDGRRLAALLCAALVPACTGAGGADLGAAPGDPDASLGGGPDLAEPRDLVPGPDLIPSPGYPLGPYGNKVGDTAPDFSLPGYLSTKTAGLASTEPFGDVRMNDLRQSGARFALIELAGFW